MRELESILATFSKPMRAAVALSLVCTAAGYALPAFAQAQITATTSATDEAQVPQTIVSPPVVPQQVRYAGKLAARSSESVEAVFRVYAASEGGEPLWSETQQVSVAADGSYSVLLGAATAAGLPQSVFSGGEARWLGVTVERGEEQDRVLLSSVPYAMKSADAESLAGHAAAEFATKDQLAGLATKVDAVERAAAAAPALAGGIHPEASPPTTGTGATNTIPLWTSSSTLGNSIVTQANGKIGINYAAPSATLEVGGGMTVHGTMAFPPGVPATSTQSSQSQSFTFSASAWNSTTAAPVSSTYTMLAGPTGNNTATPNAIFYFQYQNGTNPLINMFTLNGKGVMTLPNSTGGLVSNGNISLTPSTLATASTPTNSPLLEIGASSYSSSSSVAKAQTFAWQAQASGNDTATPTGTLALLFGENGATPTATGLSVAQNGQITFASGQTFPVTGTGGGTITGITTSSPLTGAGTTGSVALGLNETQLTTDITPALESTFSTIYPQLSSPNSFSSYQNFNAGINVSMALGSAYAGVNALGTNGSTGVYGGSDTGYGVQGASTSGYAGYFTSKMNSDPTLYAENDATSFGKAVEGYSSAQYGVGIFGDTPGDGATAVFGAAIGGTNSTGVFGSVSGPGSTGVWGVADGAATSTQPAGNGVYGLSASGIGVIGQTTGSSTTGSNVSQNGAWGVWADNGSQNPGANAALLATADDTYAALFYNNSTDNNTIQAANVGTGQAAEFSNGSNGSPTLAVYNSGEAYAAQMENYSNTYATLYLYNGLGGPITSAAPFKTLMASTPTGTCGFGGNGDMSCTGQVKALVSTSGGARRVETYAPQSAENWMEDYGSGNLEKGVAVVKLDPAFAETVSETPDYHVFITPNGDSRGLYVIKKTMASFEVRESGGGVSSLTFDYKIVAKRRGYESQRLIDVTDRFNAEVKAATPVRRVAPIHPTTHRKVIQPPAPPEIQHHAPEVHQAGIRPLVQPEHRD